MLINVHGVCIHVGRVEGEVKLVCVPSSLVRITRLVSEEDAPLLGSITSYY